MSRQENLLDKLAKAYDQWENLQKQGGSDPFYPDGVNLNLIRNHILYYKQRIEEEQPLYKNTQMFQRALPPKVDDSYMARSEEIRSHAKDSLAAYLADPYYQYLIHHWEELDDEGLKKTSIRSVLNYVQGLKTAIRKDDLVSFRSCAEKVRDFLANQEINLFVLANQSDFPFPEKKELSQGMTM